MEAEGRGGRSITQPDAADRVADDTYVKRISLQAVAKELPIGNRAELREMTRGGPEGPRRSLVVTLEETFAKVVS